MFATGNQAAVKEREQRGRKEGRQSRVPKVVSAPQEGQKPNAHNSKWQDLSANIRWLSKVG